MIKTIKSFFGVLAIMSVILINPTVSKADLGGLSVGATWTLAGIDTDGKETDPEGTIVNGGVSETAQIPSVFLQYTHVMDGNFAVTVGADYIPMSAEFVAESKADTDLTSIAGGTTSGTKKLMLILKTT